MLDEKANRRAGIVKCFSKATLLSVVKLNQDIKPEKYDWRFDLVGTSGTLYILENILKEQAVMMIRDGRACLGTSKGDIVINPPEKPGDDKLLTITTRNSIWTFKIH